MGSENLRNCVLKFVDYHKKLSLSISPNMLRIHLVNYLDINPPASKASCEVANLIEKNRYPRQVEHCLTRGQKGQGQGPNKQHFVPISREHIIVHICWNAYHGQFFPY